MQDFVEYDGENVFLLDDKIIKGNSLIKLCNGNHISMKKANLPETVFVIVLSNKEIQQVFKKMEEIDAIE